MTWTDTRHCQSRAHCRRCRADAGWRLEIALRWGGFSCPDDPAICAHGPDVTAPPTTDTAWDTFVVAVRAHGSPRLQAELAEVLARLPALCVCSRETLKQRFMGNHPTPAVG